ncbi:MAG: hypothetical protein AAF755_10700 [Pseudomonadota bacterium]
MKRKEFVDLVGERLTHVTPARNRAGIAARGLMSAASLAQASGVAPGRIILRSDRRALSLPEGEAVLTHQRPLLQGAATAQRFLDAHTLESWAAQLDQRIFLWPKRKGRAFEKSFGQAVHVLSLCAGALFDACADHVFLSPINSGNATRRPARRGDWLYVPATAPVSAFKDNRRRRGLTRQRDTVAEVSLTCALPPDVLARVCR